MVTRLFRKGFGNGFRKFGLSVAEIVNAVLLTIMYVVGVGLAALLVRLSGKSLLNLGRKKQKSYYGEKNIGSEEMEEYYRQF